MSDDANDDNDDGNCDARKFHGGVVGLDNFDDDYYSHDDDDNDDEKSDARKFHGDVAQLYDVDDD